MRLLFILFFISFSVHADTPDALKKEIEALKAKMIFIGEQVTRVEIIDLGKPGAALPIGKIEVTYQNGLKRVIHIPLDLTAQQELKASWVEVTFNRYLRGQLFPTIRLTDGRTYSFGQALTALLEYVKHENTLLNEFYRKDERRPSMVRMFTPGPYYFVELTDRWKNRAVELMAGKFGHEYFVTDSGFWKHWGGPKDKLHKEPVSGKEMYLPELKLAEMINYYEGLEKKINEDIKLANEDLGKTTKAYDRLFILDEGTFFRDEGLLDLETRKARVVLILNLLRRYSGVILSLEVGVKRFPKNSFFYRHEGRFHSGASWDVFFKRQRHVQFLEGKIQQLIMIKEAMENGKALDWQKTWKSVVTDLEALGPEGHVVTPLILMQEIIDLITKLSPKGIAALNVENQEKLTEVLEQTSHMRTRIFSYMETIAIELKIAEKALEQAQRARVKVDAEIKLREATVFRLAAEMKILRIQLENINTITAKVRVR